MKWQQKTALNLWETWPQQNLENSEISKHRSKIIVFTTFVSWVYTRLVPDDICHNCHNETLLLDKPNEKQRGTKTKKKSAFFQNRKSFETNHMINLNLNSEFNEFGW